jgi:hypothetical protein
MQTSDISLCHLVFIAAVATTLTLPIAEAQTSFQEGVTPTVSYTHDATYIRSNAVDGNFNDDPDLELIVGTTTGGTADILRSLLEFDLSAVRTSDQADSVSLVLTTHSTTGLDQGGVDGNPIFDVYSYGFDIDDTAATWGAPGDGDTTAGGTLGTLLTSASFDVTVTGQAITFGDTPAFHSAVDDTLAGDGILRLIVVKHDESTIGTHEFARFAADSFATEGDRPELNIEHSPSGIGFAITVIDYSPGADTVTLTWTSRPGAKYTVKYSRDLTNWEADLDDSIEADAGETTTRTYSVTGLATADGELFFRVERD